MSDPSKSQARAYPSPGAPGLTKRELFAAMAMQGLMASDVDGLWPTFAHGAVQAADALIAALEKTND